MSFRKNLLSMVFLPSLLLVGCGGGGDFSLGNGDGSLAGGGSSGGGSSSGGDGSSSSGGSSDTSTTNVSYLPLSLFVKYSDYVSDLDVDNVFLSGNSFPFIKEYLINPIDSTSLLPVNNATVDDYVMTVNEIEIDPTESFPMLQKVIGNNVSLKTALVFDITGSTSEVDLLALQNEAKAYVTKAQAHTNSTIANQSFVVWSLGEDDPAVDDVKDLTGGFTQDPAAIESAIDSLVLLPSASSNLHKAIVKVVGGYVDTAAIPPIDFTADGDNDLTDDISSNGISLTEIVLFSSGPDTKGEFEQSKMIEAIQSQGLLKYNLDGTADSEGFTNKPLFYFVLGLNEQGSAYSALSDVSEKTSYLTLSGGEYSFSDALILDQIESIESRIDVDNQYVYRYAFLPRQGDHERKFQSRSSGFNYTLSGETKFAVPVSIGTPYYELESSVEITGPNGEYISGAATGEAPFFVDGEYLSGGEISFAEESTFRAATRWTNETFSASDYSWSLVGGTGTDNGDGSYTVNSVAGATATLTVDNTSNGQSAFITITN